MTDSKSRLAPVMLALATTAITLAIVAGVGEAAVRYRERHRATPPGTMPLLYYRHARLGHALVHNYDYFGWVHINSDGFRGPEISRVKTPENFRILVLGGSAAFDGYVSADSLTWPARMQREVQKLLPQRRVEVINGGLPGKGVVDQSIRLLTGLGRLPVDLLILYTGDNDLFQNLRSAQAPEIRSETQTPDEVVTKTPWMHWLERHSLLYCKLVDAFHARGFAALGRRAPAAPAAGSVGSAVDDGAARFETDVAAFVGVAQAYGIRLVLASPTTVSAPDATEPADRSVAAEWHDALPFATPTIALRGFTNYRGALHRTAERMHLPLIRTETFGIWGRRWYASDDPIHFNDAGAACMGRRMADALHAAGLLPEPAASGSAARSQPAASAVSVGCEGA